jgi:hypothetical protein
MEVARVGSLERVMRSNRRLPFDERQPRATEKPASGVFKSGALYNPGPPATGGPGVVIYDA